MMRIKSKSTLKSLYHLQFHGHFLCLCFIILNRMKGNEAPIAVALHYRRLVGKFLVHILRFVTPARMNQSKSEARSKGWIGSWLLLSITTDGKYLCTSSAFQQISYTPLDWAFKNISYMACVITSQSSTVAKVIWIYQIVLDTST